MDELLKGAEGMLREVARTTRGRNGEPSLLAALFDEYDRRGAEIVSLRGQLAERGERRET